MIDGTNATNETENYGYPQFVAEDKPGWLTDWNKTMEAIDANEADIQAQVTENKEDLEALEMTVTRHEEELNGEHGAFQRIADNQNRIQDLEEKVGDDEHGLIKDMNDVKRDLTETNTMAVKTNGAVNSIRDLICNPFISTSQYNPGAYVYLQDADDGEIHYYKCNTLHRGAFNPDHFDDVTEKLITALDNSGGGSGSQYVLPVAGSADDVDPILGGVIIGDGLVIDPETGVLSTEGGGGGGGDVPYASKLQAGIMKPGNGLSDGHDNGTIDVLVDNDTIVINQETGRLEAHKEFTPQDLPIATENTVGVVKGKSSLNNNEGKVNIANDGAMSVAIDNDYIKRKSDGSLTVNPDKIGSASAINVGEGLEKPDSDTIALKRGTPSQMGGWKPDARDFYKENDKDMIQLKPNGGLEHTAEGIAVVGGGGGGGTTYSAGDGIDITNDEISVKADPASSNALVVGPNGVKVGIDNSTVRKNVGGNLFVPTAGSLINGARVNTGLITSIAGYTINNGVASKNQEYSGDKAVSQDVDSEVMKLMFDNVLPSRVTVTIGQATTIVNYGISIEFDPTTGTLTGDTINVNDCVGQVGPVLQPLDPCSSSYTSSNGVLQVNAFKCVQQFDTATLFNVITDPDDPELYTYELRENVNLSAYFEQISSNKLDRQLDILKTEKSNIIRHRRYNSTTGTAYPSPLYGLVHSGSGQSGDAPAIAMYDLHTSTDLEIPLANRLRPLVLFMNYVFNVPSTSPLANLATGNLADLIIKISLYSTDGTYIELLRRVIKVDRSQFSGASGNLVLVDEEGTGNGLDGLDCFIPPCDVDKIRIEAKLQVTDLSNGNITTYPIAASGGAINWETNSDAPNSYNGSFAALYDFGLEGSVMGYNYDNWVIY